MSSSRHDRPGTLAMVVLLGCAGAGLVLVAMRQGWAQVVTQPSKPLPASVVSLTGQDLIPAASPLAVAAVAALAAVAATRRLARRLTGIVLGGLGIGIAAAASLTISARDMLAAAAGTAGPAAGAGAGTAPGSATSGGGQGGPAPSVTGLPAHAVLYVLPWRGVAVTGALLLVGCGLLVAWRADRLPVMSGRFDPPGGGGGAAARAGAAAAGADGDNASLWESLSRGEDPTALAAEPAAHRDGGSRGDQRPGMPGDPRPDGDEPGVTEALG